MRTNISASSSSQRPFLSGGWLARLLPCWGWLGIVLLAYGAHTLWAAGPVNDSFAGRLPLFGSTNLVTGSNVGATGEAGESSHAGNSAAASVWWTWVAPDNGMVVVDTAGSSFDTVLAVYTGEAVNALTLVAENDDAPGLSTSSVSFSAVQGTRYQIVVDGFSGAQGSVQLAVRLPVAPTPPTIVGQPASQTVLDGAGSNVTFTVAFTGSFPLGLVWQKGGVAQAGATNVSFTVTNATLGKAGDYSVIITNAYGSVTSSVAKLTVLAPLVNDSFANRLPVVGQSNTVTGYNYGATLEAGEPVHAGVPAGASVWWSWTAPQSGLVTLDTAGSTNYTGTVLDTVLAVYVGTSVNALTPVAGNNDAVPGSLVSSRVFFRAVAGVTYQFAVAGGLDIHGAAAVGGITLNLVQAPDNDAFANALIFPVGATRVYDNNKGATKEAGEPDHGGNPGGRSVWWKWVAPASGTYVLDTVGSSFDTVLAIYKGTNVGNLTLVGEDHNRGPNGASVVKFLAAAGTVFQLAVDGYAGSNGVPSGDIVLNLNASLVSNDNFAERFTLGGRTNRVTASNIGATKENGEPNHGGNAGGRSLWWAWTAPITGPVLVTTYMSTFDTTLAVYTGTNISALTLVAENDDAESSLVNLITITPGSAAFLPGVPVGQTNLTNGASLLGFQGIAGQTYQIAVDGYASGIGNAATGSVVLTLAQPTVPTLGGNDMFANRYAITGQSNQVFGVNTNASKEAGEPDHDGNSGGRSLWWAWVAPVSGPVQVETSGSDFTPVIGIYQGASVDALTFVASDKGSLGVFLGKRQAGITFQAVQGVEYEIAVDGFDDGFGPETGKVVLNLRQFLVGPLAANDDFASATPIVDGFFTVLGNNIGATRQPGEPAHAGAPHGHSVWWSWQPDADGPVTITTFGSQFDTVLAVYTGDSVDALSLVAENDNASTDFEQSSVTFQAAAGTVYHIAVDGYADEYGQIVLNLIPGQDDGMTAPQILQAPLDQTRFAGGGGGGTNVPFRVVASGSLPLTYQWLRNGTNLPGAVGDTLILTNASALDAGTYQVTVSNASGVVTSAGAELTVLSNPFNDSFSSRILITGASNTVRGSVLNATKEPGEPNHAGENGGRSVWWKWVAPSNGPVEIYCSGNPFANFDTLLSVYTGTAIGSLTLVAENDDLVDGIFASRVTFNAVSGQEYQIVADTVKTNSRTGSLSLTVAQPPPPPQIVVQPASLYLVHVTNANFSLGVTTAGLASLFQYQWLFNGTPIPNATNASFSLGPLSRTNSGLYALVISNDYGGVTSSNAQVWVQVPQRLLSPQRLPDGRTQLFFSDPDGTLSTDPTRFEVHHTLNPSGATTVWTTNHGGITTSNGRLLYVDQTSSGVSRRTYRIIEK